MKYIKLSNLIVATAMMLTSMPAFAVGSSGFENATLSTRSLSRGNAVTANPEDPSTIAFNPAGLTKLKKTQAYLGSTVFLTNYSYDGEGIGGRGAEKSSQSLLVTPYGYVSLPTPIEGLTIGAGANSPFGLVTKYSSVGSQRHVAFYNELKTSAYHMSAGYQLLPNLSIGAGGSLVELELKQVGKFNRSIAAGTPNDAVYEYDVEGQGMGFNLGMLWDITENDALGVFYRSEVRNHLKGHMSTHDLNGTLAAVFGGLSNVTSADTDLTLPANITVGYNRRFNSKFDYAVELSWTDWGAYDVSKTLFGTSNAILAGFESIARDFKDVFSVHTGGSYDFNETWTMNMGYYWQDMAANPANYTSEIPDGDRHGITAGFEYRFCKTWSADFNYLIVVSPEVDIANAAGNGNSTDIDGSYGSFMQIWSFGLRNEF